MKPYDPFCDTLVPLAINDLLVWSEQEVTGDDTLALQSVLESDEKREGLLKEERDINAQMADG